MIMPEPLFEISAAGASQRKVTPQLLPCRIHHDGSVEPIQSFWLPTIGDDGKNTAYFRGRKLDGQKVKLPQGFRGVVVEKHQPEQKSDRRPEDLEIVDVDQEDEIETGKIQETAGFDEIMVWRADGSSDDSGDPYARGMDEWLAFSGQIHAYPTEQSKD